MESEPAEALATDGDPMRPRPVLDDGRGRTVRAERLMAIVSVHSATIAEGFVYLAVWAGWLALLAATSTAIMAVTSIVVAVLLGVAACITISEGDRGPGSAHAGFNAHHRHVGGRRLAVAVGLPVSDAPTVARIWSVIRPTDVSWETNGIVRNIVSSTFIAPLVPPAVQRFIAQGWQPARAWATHRAQERVRRVRALVRVRSERSRRWTKVGGVTVTEPMAMLRLDHI